MKSITAAAKVLAIFVVVSGLSVVHASTLFNQIPGGGVSLDLTNGFDIVGGGGFVSPSFPANPIVLFDPGLPHPSNAVLFGTDANTTTQIEQAVFLLAGATPNGADLLIPGVVNPVTAITDAGLLALSGPVVFDFTPSTQASVYSLVSITSLAPEPSSALLFLIGGAVFVQRRVTSRRKTR